VFAAGNPISPVSYTVTPAGTAPATPGDDFQVSSPNPLTIGAGRVGFIEIGIVNDMLALDRLRRLPAGRRVVPHDVWRRIVPRGARTPGG
jgi:hypothetical protein